MKVNVLWIVEFPRLKSQICDILARSNVRSLELQFKGGLAATDISAIFTDESEAIEAAETLIRRRNSALENGMKTDAEIRAYCEAMQ
jgi:hypothetical protein